MEKLEEWKLTGEIIHYFGKIGVAVIKLSESLKKGERIRVVGGVDTDFEQDIKSMQVDHQSIEKAKKGDEIGLKLKEKAREGYKVYKSK